MSRTHAAPHELGQDLGGVAEQADRDRLRAARTRRAASRARRRGRSPAGRGSASPGASRSRLAGIRSASIDAPAIVAASGCAPPMPPRPGGQDPLVGELAAAMLAAGLGERLVRALHDALAADVDPRAGRHLAEHHEALAVELVEVLPRRPLRHEVGVGDQHARRVGMRLEHADRLARLDQQRLVVARARAARRRSRRSTPSCARRGRCRRRRRAPSDSRRPRDRGCS